MAINNVIVGIGDIFSFNTIVGPRDVTNGYQEAPEIIKGKLVMGIGEEFVKLLPHYSMRSIE